MEYTEYALAPPNASPARRLAPAPTAPGRRRICRYRGKSDSLLGHASGQPKVPEIVVREPVVFEDPDCVTPRPTLSTAEIAHFKEQGFIVKRELIGDPDIFAEIVDYLWTNVPRQILRRDDPATWLDAPKKSGPKRMFRALVASPTATGRCARPGRGVSAPKGSWWRASPTSRT